MSYHTVNIDNPAYPPLLREIASAPKTLYALGDISLLSTPQIALVGTRKPTASGRDTARRFAYELANLGLTITSGLALGVDGACHEGALQAKGKTIAVLGCGLNRIYPARHAVLAQQIAEQGLLLSEFPADTPPLASNFPQRNRIISGLSLATVVVEAAVKSGSLITAHLAADQGREVFAVPGSIYNPQAKGCHELLRQGAKLVESVNDIIQELAPALQLTLPLDIASPNPATVTAVDKKVSFMLQYLGFEPTPLDKVVARCGLAADQVAAILMQLELEGLVESSPFGFMKM